MTVARPTYDIWLARAAHLGAFVGSLYLGAAYDTPFFRTFGFAGPWFPAYYLPPLAGLYGLIAVQRNACWRITSTPTRRLLLSTAIIALLAAVTLWAWSAERQGSLWKLREQFRGVPDAQTEYLQFLALQEPAAYWAALCGIIAAVAVAGLAHRRDYWTAFSWYTWSVAAVTFVAFLGDGASSGYARVYTDPAESAWLRVPPMTALAALMAAAPLVLAAVVRNKILREAQARPTQGQ